MRVSSSRGCSAPTATMGLVARSVSKPSGRPTDFLQAISFSMTWNSETVLRRQLESALVSHRQPAKLCFGGIATYLCWGTFP